MLRAWSVVIILASAVGVANDDANILRAKEVTGSEIRIVDGKSPIAFSAVGRIGYQNLRGSIISGGTGFIFQREYLGVTRYYVAATAHELYNLGKWKGATRPDDSPDFDNLFFFNTHCTIKAAPGALRIGTRNIDPDARNDSLDERANDWLVFRLEGKPCDRIKPLDIGSVDAAKLANAQIVVSGTHGQIVDGINRPVTEYAECRGADLESGRTGTMIYHRCSTRPGSSGGPIMIFDANKQLRVIGIHRGVSDESEKRGSGNEGVFLSPELLSEWKI